MLVCGFDIDDPKENPLPRCECREFSERERTKVREAWLCSYHTTGAETSIWRHCVTMTNRGVCTFDGHKVTDRADLERIKEIFGGLKFS